SISEVRAPDRGGGTAYGAARLGTGGRGSTGMGAEEGRTRWKGRRGWKGLGLRRGGERVLSVLSPFPSAMLETRRPLVKACHKFLLGAALIVGSVGFLIAEGVKETGVYFLTPTELAAKTTSDPTFVENVGFKVGAKVVPGSVHRDNASRTIDFRVSDGVKTYP